MSNWFISVVRTVVPTIVGAVIAWLTVHGFDWLNLVAYGDQISAWLVVVCISLYYALARWLEQKFPQAGILLGYVRKPVYVPETVPTEQ
jgi:Na+/pantothenate symporter